MNDIPGPVRAVVAITNRKRAFVVTHDSELLDYDIDALNEGADELGLMEPADYEREPGLYIWEGTAKTAFQRSLDGDEPYTEYEGRITQQLVGENICSWLAMRPPVDPKDQENWIT